MSPVLPPPPATVPRCFVRAGLLATRVLVVAGMIAFRAMRTAEAAGGWVARTHAFIARLEGTRAALPRAESAQRAHLLTGGPTPRGAFASAATQAREHVDAVARLTPDIPTQQRLVPWLRHLLEQRADGLADGVALRDAGREAEAVANVASRGIGQMVAVQAAPERMNSEEERLLELRLEHAGNAAQLE